MSGSQQELNSILVIHGSARVDSDTQKYVAFTFSSTRHTYLDLNSYEIEHYNYEGDYSPTDDFDEVLETMLRHQVIVFATPVYWYAMSGRMKTLFDRFTDIITINKEAGRALEGKSVAMLAVGNDADFPEGFIVPFRDTAHYLNMKYLGEVYFSSARPMDSSHSIAAKDRFVNLLI